MLAIERATTNSIDDVHLKEQLWRELQQTHIARWQRLADLWVSAYFGNTMTPEEYRALAAYLQHFPGNSEFPGKSATLLTDAQLNHFLQHPAVTDNDYFHWELAFPEVFFDEYGRSRHEAAGFDAVIGNPPYVRQEQLTPLKPYFQKQFASYSGSADLYLYFYEQGFKLLQNEAFLSFISSGTFAKTNSAKPFREWFTKHANLEILIDFGENQPFEGAEMVRPSILVITKGDQKKIFQSMFMDGTDIWEPLDVALDEHGFECSAEVLNQIEWTFQSIQKSNLANKLFSQGSSLG